MLHTLRPTHGTTKRRKRVARGNSGKGGTTAGRGTKGQQSRTGKGRAFGFEGGQTPLLRRQPKLGGFARPRAVSYEPLNVDVLEARLPAGEYDVVSLQAHRLIHGKLPVKLLGRGTLAKKFVLKVHAASKSAAEAVKKAGGSVTIVKDA